MQGDRVNAPVVGLVGCSAGGVEEIGPKLAQPMIELGWQVAVTLTPTAAEWLMATGEVQRLEALTGWPVRWTARLPGQARPHPPVSCYVVAPATANTVAKLALGIGDDQALTQVCEGIGNRNLEMIVFPRVNAAHARQPAWESHLGALRKVGVRLIYGEHVWPLHEPRSTPDRSLPWDAILAETKHVMNRR